MNDILYLFGTMSPYLLFGFLVAGILHTFVPRVVYSKYLSDNSMRAVALAALIGVPLPLCSCGVIPTAASMRREGASRAATVSFLIATPQTGVDSIAATASVLGLPFALLRPLAALLTALFGGGATALLISDSTTEQIAAAENNTYNGLWAKIKGAIKYGFGDMIQDVGKWLVLGLVIAGLITVFVPDGFFLAFADRPLLGMLAVLVAAAPMYLCATGSVPIAAALMLKGLSPGAAFVLLMAGPATNMAAMIVIDKVLGHRSLAVYLISIIIGALSFGLIIDNLLPLEWFTLLGGAVSSDCCQNELSVVQVVSSVIFAALLVVAFVNKHRSHRVKNSITERKYSVTGMMCNHCKANVERNLLALPGVESVTVELSSGMVTVTGTVDDKAVVDCITSLGYGVLQQ